MPTDPYFFTSVDDKIIQSDSIRDPLGIQPVWSTIGRRLVPCLSGSAWQIEGIIAVMAIQGLAEERLRDPANKDESGYWRLMEGLVEYHLFQTEGREPCHGKRALEANGEKLELSPNDTRTLCTGLRQYYRGTCVRAGMLDKVYTVNSSWRDAMNTVFNNHTQAIKKLGKALNHAIEEQEPVRPAEHFEDLKQQWEALFENPEIRELLKQRLLGNTDQTRFALWAYESRESGNDDTHARFEQIKQESDKEPWSLANDLEAVFRCAPFISLLERLLNLLLALDGDTVEAAAEKLSTTVLREEGARFLGLRNIDSLNTNRRFRPFFELAEYANHEEWSKLASQVIEHHQSVAQERGKKPFIQIDNDQIVVGDPILGNTKELVDSLKSPEPWHYDFYASVAASIHGQLYGAQG